MAARGPGLRHPPSQALRRDRADGGEPGPAARRVPGPGAGGGAGAAGGLRGERRGDRPAEAPLEHLREDGRPGQGVRRPLRPGRDPGHRRVREGLLGGARLDPRHLAPGPGTVQGLHQLAQVQPLPVAAHDGDRARRQAHRGAGPHPRDAPAGRVRHRRPLGVQGEAGPARPGAGPSGKGGKRGRGRHDRHPAPAPTSPPKEAKRGRRPRSARRSGRKGSPRAAAQRAGVWPNGTAGPSGRPGQGDVVDHRRDRVDAADRRLPERDHRPHRVPRGPQARPRGGRGLRLHPEGQGHRPGRQRHAGRLRLRHPHRGRPPLHRGQGQRPPGPPRHPAQLGRHRGDLHLQGPDGRPVARLAGAWWPRRGPAPRSASGSPGSGARTPSSSAARS